jgi:hypothetical protein
MSLRKNMPWKRKYVADEEYPGLTCPHLYAWCDGKEYVEKEELGT